MLEHVLLCDLFIYFCQKFSYLSPISTRQINSRDEINKKKKLKNFFYLLLCPINRLSPNKSRKMSDRKAVIKNADMSEEMQQDAVDCATQALEKYNIEKVSTRCT